MLTFLRVGWLWPQHVVIYRKSTPCSRGVTRIRHLPSDLVQDPRGNKLRFMTRVGLKSRAESWVRNQMKWSEDPESKEGNQAQKNNNSLVWTLESSAEHKQTKKRMSRSPPRLTKSVTLEVEPWIGILKVLQVILCEAKFEIHSSKYLLSLNNLWPWMMMFIGLVANEKAQILVPLVNTY